MVSSTFAAREDPQARAALSCTVGKRKTRATPLAQGTISSMRQFWSATSRDLSERMKSLLPSCPEEHSLLHGNASVRNVLGQGGTMTAVRDASSGDGVSALAIFGFWTGWMQVSERFSQDDQEHQRRDLFPQSVCSVLSGITRSAGCASSRPQAMSGHASGRAGFSSTRWMRVLEKISRRERKTLVASCGQRFA